MRMAQTIKELELDAPEDKQDQETETTVESLAKEMGWRDDWDGPEENYVSADQFIRNAKKIQDALTNSVHHLKEDVQTMRSKMEDMAVSTGRQLAQATDQIRKRLEAEKLEAVEEGDREKYVKADSKLKELDTSPAQEEKKAPTQRERDFQEKYVKFQNDNSSWWEKDDEMTAYAISMGQGLFAANNNISADEYYQKVHNLVRRHFPERFENMNKGRPPAVSGDKPAKKGKMSAWDKVVQDYPEAQQIFQNFVEDGVFKDTNEAREKYAQRVLNQEA